MDSHDRSQSLGFQLDSEFARLRRVLIPPQP